MMKPCARCGGKFDDTGYEVFITCQSCRIPLPASVDMGGCHYWSSAAPDPRVTKARSDFEIKVNEVSR